jgi:hypothetical protein
MPFVLNSGSAAGLLNLNVVSGVVPPAPSYPFPSTGLVGWYDATKTATLLLNDADGNAIASGTDGGYVNTWNNSYTGSGALSAMTNPYGGQQDTYSTAQRFGINQASGNYHPAVGGNVHLNLNLSSSTTWTWFYVVPVLTGADGTVLELLDQQSDQAATIDQSSGAYSASPNGGKGGGMINNTSGLYFNGSNFASFAQGSYVQNTSFSTVYYNGSSYLSDGNTSGVSFVDLASNLKRLGSYDPPWASITLGTGYGLIGEFIIYNTKVSATDVKTILQYLITKWS